MITNGLLNLAHGLVSFIIGLFPDGELLPTEIHTAASYLGGYLELLEGIIPITTLVTVIGIVFAVEIALYGFRTFRWIISHLPFIGGK